MKMVSFRISAPGKVILFGEHAVVYGKTALAGSLSLSSYLTFNQLTLEKHIQINMPLVSLSRTISMDDIRNKLLNSNFPNLSKNGHEDFYQSIQKFVDDLNPVDNRQRCSLECFFYALMQVVQEKGLIIEPFQATLGTELPVGAGAGSSASFAVCLTATFLYWAQIQKKNYSIDLNPSFNSATLKEVSSYAYNCEKIMHGRPSGIDNSVCTYGAVIEFRRDESLKFISLCGKQIKVLLVDTKIGRSTKTLVDKLAGLKNQYPDIYDKVINAIDAVSMKVISILNKMKNLKDDSIEITESYKELAVSFLLNNFFFI